MSRLSKERLGKGKAEELTRILVELDEMSKECRQRTLAWKVLKSIVKGWGNWKDSPRGKPQPINSLVKPKLSI